jgi:hypothetical protein
MRSCRAFHNVVHRLCTWLHRCGKSGPRRTLTGPWLVSWLVKAGVSGQTRDGHTVTRARGAGGTGETSVGGNLTPARGAAQPVIHRLGWRPGATLHSLTLRDRAAYRWPVARRCRNRPREPPWTTRSSDHKTLPWKRCREQAYLPAEQPPPSQGARVPPADAHARRPFDHLLASPQGPQDPRGLSGRARGLVLPGRAECSPLSTGSGPVTPSGAPSAVAGVLARAHWSCTSAPHRSHRTRSRHGSASSSVARSAERWSETGCAGDFAT